MNLEDLKKLTKPKKSKYRSTRITVDGQKFDSKAEAARWLVLRKWEEAGDIAMLQRQVVFRFMSGIKYIADFKYYCMRPTKEWASTGWVYAEDVKGHLTRDFRMKRKLLKHEYGVDVNIVKMNASAVNLILAAHGVRG